MAANQGSLESQAEIIRDETTQFANTPLRVGTWMRELITWIVSQFATKQNLSELDSELVFNTGAWHFGSQREAVFKQTITTDLTIVITQTHLRSFIGELDITNEDALSFESSVTFLKNGLPESATFASGILTITPPASNTQYIMAMYNVNGVYNCTLREKES